MAYRRSILRDGPSPSSVPPRDEPLLTLCLSPQTPERGGVDIGLRDEGEAGVGTDAPGKIRAGTAAGCRLAQFDRQLVEPRRDIVAGAPGLGEHTLDLGEGGADIGVLVHWSVPSLPMKV